MNPTVEFHGREVIDVDADRIDRLREILQEEYEEVEFGEAFIEALESPEDLETYLQQKMEEREQRFQDAISTFADF